MNTARIESYRESTDLLITAGTRALTPAERTEFLHILAEGSRHAGSGSGQAKLAHQAATSAGRRHANPERSALTVLIGASRKPALIGLAGVAWAASATFLTSQLINAIR